MNVYTDYVVFKMFPSFVTATNAAISYPCPRNVYYIPTTPCTPEIKEGKRRSQIQKPNIAEWRKLFQNTVFTLELFFQENCSVFLKANLGLSKLHSIITTYGHYTGLKGIAEMLKGR